MELQRGTIKPGTKVVITIEATVMQDGTYGTHAAYGKDNQHMLVIPERGAAGVTIRTA